MTKQNISYHLNNIFKEKELIKDSTVKEILTVQKEGVRNVQRAIKIFRKVFIRAAVFHHPQ